MSVRSASARFSSVPNDQHGKLLMMAGRTRFGFSSRTLIPLASGPRSPAARQDDVPPSLPAAIGDEKAFFVPIVPLKGHW
jgi:hypothetical protein